MRESKRERECIYLYIGMAIMSKIPENNDTEHRMITNGTGKTYMKDRYRGYVKAVRT